MNVFDDLRRLAFEKPWATTDDAEGSGAFRLFGDWVLGLSINK